MTITGIDLSNLDTRPYFKRQVQHICILLGDLVSAEAIGFYLPDKTHSFSKVHGQGDSFDELPAELPADSFDSLVELNPPAECIHSFKEIPRGLTGGNEVYLMPVRDNGELLAVILMAGEEISPQIRGQEQRVEEICQIAAAAARCTIFLEQYKQRSEQLTVMLEVNTHLNVAATKTDFLFEITRFGRYFMQFDRTVLVLRPEETPEYFIIDAIEGDESGLQRGMTYPIVDSLAGRCILTGQHQTFHRDHKELPDGIYRPGDLQDYPYTQAMAFPLAKVKEAPGALILESTQPFKLKPENIRMFEMISQTLGASLNRFSLYERLNNYASIDTLTHLYNLRALKQRFEEELARASRYQNNLTVLFLDLDKFKSVNDNYGHLMGDYVLRETARLIKESVRTADVVSRYGGEEFVVIMINSDAQACLVSAKRICQAIREFPFEMNDIQLNTRISIGLSEFPRDGELMDDLIEAADAAMYTAKRAGGDRVVRYKKGMVPKNQQ